MNYKVVMAYDGTRYNGWQKQGNTDKTIQGKLEQILLKMTGEEIEVHGSGRTDAGVHAKGQVANFHIDWKELEKNGKNGKNGKNVSDLKSKKEEYGGKKTPDQIMEYINEYLPEDIAVLSCEAVPEHFHSQFGHTHFSITHSGRRVSVNGAKVTMPIYQQIAGRKILCHTYCGFIYGDITMRMILTKNIADNTSRLLIWFARKHTSFLHRIKDSSVYRLETISHIRKCTGYNN